MAVPNRDGHDGHGAALVVIVDDDPAVLHSLKFSLEVEGFASRVYRSPSEILAASDLPANGCLILDQRLPEMSGLELLANLRARGVRLPAVLITSFPSALLRDRARLAGTALIEKPILGNALTEAIRRAMGAAPA